MKWISAKTWSKLHLKKAMDICNSLKSSHRTWKPNWLIDCIFTLFDSEWPHLNLYALHILPQCMWCNNPQTALNSKYISSSMGRMLLSHLQKLVKLNLP